MKPFMTLQVRDLKTDWNNLTIGTVEKEKRNYTLKDVTGNLIWKASSIEKIAEAGRRFAETQGYFDGAFAEAA
ncbi:hypothetical protein EGK75_01215 [Neisseria weixii]|uniref:Uncharacterized protein n=1 Tax=Neisseria weixii TaxID=1853276 RepID=A0A3N4N569_9NEIS|nr:hypothetical protein [Neisseria weixii]RPD90495.1 hypothetical protein EGK74_01730 [Neisseria weixii]RPD90563.1 hypothetical protein EGK75_01215 [Neisseria weixii]